MRNRANNWHAARVLLMGLLGMGSLTAQEGAGPGGSTKGIVVRLLAVDLLKGAETVVLGSGETRSKTIDLLTHGLTDAVRVTGRVLRVATPALEEKPGSVLAEVTLPSAGRRFLLLLVPSKDKYLCRVVRLDDPAFKPGDVCFFNVSPLPVGGMLGTRKFLTERGKPVIVKPPRQTDLPYYQVSFFYKRGKETRPLADTRWPYDERSRSYVIFYPNPKNGRIKYRAVDEVVPTRG